MAEEEEEEEGDYDDNEEDYRRKEDMLGTLDSPRTMKGKFKSYLVPLRPISDIFSGVNVMQNVYASTMSTPSIYIEHKHDQYGTLKNFFRKILGIPLALLYGFTLVWISSDIIIGESGDRAALSSRLELYSSQSIPSLHIPSNISATIFTTRAKKSSDNDSKVTGQPLKRRHSTSRNITTIKNKDSILFKNDFIELYYITGSIMGVVGVSSIFSRNARAIMLLILPGIITSRSRHVIYSIILGMLAKEPIYNLMENFNKLLETASCINRPLIACLEPIHALTTHEIIKLVILKPLRILGKYVEIARKCITVISIIMLIADAIRYLRLYYTDSSFDNMCIDQSTRKHWKKRDYYKDSEEYQKYSLAGWDDKEGLRRWEINEGLKTWNLPKCTMKLCYKVLRNSFSTLVFIGFVLLVLGFDYIMAEAFQYVKQIYETQKSTVLPQRFTQNITESRHYNTRSCLTSPHYTSKILYLVTSFLLLMAIVSCVLELFTSGIRAGLCSFFYPDRAEERADYLYYKVITGRINRKFHLLLLVRREMERRSRLLRFSPLQRIKKKFLGKTKILVCAGCGWNVQTFEARQLSFSVAGRRNITKICRDCELDLSRKYGVREREHLLSDDDAFEDS